jgi:hypothetical protein
VKNKNNADFCKVAVKAYPPHYGCGTDVPCKLVRNNAINQERIPPCIPPTERQEEEPQAKNSKHQRPLIPPLFHFRKNEKSIIPFKRSIFSAIYFFYFL